MKKRLIPCVLILALVLSLLCGCDKVPGKTDDTIGDSPMPKTKAEQLLATISPQDADYYAKLAEFAVSDLISNFWVGDASTGNVVPTWEGLPGDNLADERGAIWEAAEVLFNIYDMWVLTGNETYKSMVVSEANYFKTNFEPEQLEEASALLHTASDDCAWHAMLYLCFYNVTQDDWFVERAINLLDNAYNRWHDEQMGGGMWYRDGFDRKSLYEAGIALDWLRIWEITGEQRFYDLAFASYSWMQECLGREDGLYFCEATTAGPVGEFNEGGIHEGGSVSFLAGNMAMASLSAKFYKLTKDETYLQRVYKTNEGLLQYYNNDGILLDDRDAWTNGTFTAFYVSEVLSLPDTEQMQELLKNTAVSVVTNDRTADGYYGGTWQGPAEGAASIWYSGGSIPQQTMTSGTAVMLVVGAAMLEAGINDYVR